MSPLMTHLHLFPFASPETLTFHSLLLILKKGSILTAASYNRKIDPWTALRFTHLVLIGRAEACIFAEQQGWT